MQEIHADFYLREAHNLCPAAVIPLQYPRQHLGARKTCMQIPSAVINNAFDAQLSEKMAKEAYYKEKSILLSSQGESGKEIGTQHHLAMSYLHQKGVHISESF